LFFQIVNGFILLRKHNIFHEDIKPENIMIKNNLYKITDFGISQLAGNIEVSAIRKGTLTYMPPEKLKGETFTPTSKT
jgi:serine/threonine protein kinase